MGLGRVGGWVAYKVRLDKTVRLFSKVIIVRCDDLQKYFV